MKAITVRQPWASLIAAGVKTIETRPRPTRYRGRIAIHAARTWPPVHELDPIWAAARAAGVAWSAPPLGAVVASAVLTDCVPMHDTCTDPIPDDLLYVTIDDRALFRQQVFGDPWVASNVKQIELTDQLPFGDFRPGRWALLLDDIVPTTQRCPACWGGASRITPGICDSGACPHCDSLCPVCRGAGRCDPVPARGQQAIPWEWTP